MKISVKVRAGAKREGIERVDQPMLDLGEANGKIEMATYKVSVKEPAVDGRANEAITRTLAKHFKVARSSVRLVSGQTSRRKIFEIANWELKKWVIFAKIGGWK
ncbi:MAG: hypothetical protein A3I39_03260 [Candidatus Yanofskybacteria bacterium RIFCSPLOWO2_02_FULL_47_9b]|uniref:UPF0235 protein A3I39_03260 n=1 Tax=Candidatus Yanofskybacteria bacterium RIFCSPLOWO2_02_FULL_47_9b TaxID=1802708 RepID=A0A1F8HB75_9BACT|nr:MAG: hypothetical protein A3I39_03260 [Candidatus Yanofskybacteria bacterium RIFCSPLOWO2_02_FULL_47_9b]